MLQHTASVDRLLDTLDPNMALVHVAEQLLPSSYTDTRLQDALIDLSKKIITTPSSSDSFFHHFHPAQVLNTTNSTSFWAASATAHMLAQRSFLKIQVSSGRYLAYDRKFP